MNVILYISCQRSMKYFEIGDNYARFDNLTSQLLTCVQHILNIEDIVRSESNIEENNLDYFNVI